MQNNYDLYKDDPLKGLSELEPEENKTTNKFYVPQKMASSYGGSKTYKGYFKGYFCANNTAQLIMKKQIFMFLFLSLYIILSCSYTKDNDDKFDILKENINYKNVLHIKYDSLVNNGIIFIFPSNIGKYQSIILKDIKTEEKKKFCKAGGNTKIIYTVKHINNTLFSCVKHVEIECSTLPSDAVYDIPFNFMILKDSIFELIFKPAIGDKQEIIDQIKSQVDSECFFQEQKNINFKQIDFIIDNNQFYLLNPLKSKICDTNIAFSSFNSKNIVFISHWK